MHGKPNVDMEEFWNGEGGLKWVSLDERLDESLKPFGAEAMRVAKVATNARVLDVGCGCGDTSLDLARRVGPEGYVHGLDISTTVLELAQKKARASGLTNIAFECADAQTQVFRGGEYDLVFSRFGVMFFDDAVAAFKNIRTALKPDGRVAFACWAAPQENPWVQVPLQIVARHLPLPPPVAADTPGPFSLSGEGRASGVLTSAGFTDVTVTAFCAPFVVGKDVAEAVRFLMQLGPAAGALAKAEPSVETRALIATEIGEMLKDFNTAQGICLDGVALIVTAGTP